MSRLSWNLIFILITSCKCQIMERRLGKLQEVFAWRQISYSINGIMILQDRFSGKDLEESKDATDDVRVAHGSEREKRQLNRVFGPFGEHGMPEGDLRFTTQRPSRQQVQQNTWNNNINNINNNNNNDTNSFFIQYNNVPMGVERVGNKLFITVPRRRYGIPSTLNYIDLNRDSNTHSPSLRPYPNLRDSRTLTSVYRTRADTCGRLWVVDTGLLEIPNNPQQIQPPAIVVYDLNTNRQILRYPFKAADIPESNTPAGLASITVDITRSCDDAFAYVPDLSTFGLIVFSLRQQDSWRVSHNYFHFSPTAGNLNIGGQRFQWSDGVFSITLTDPVGECRTAYFHPLVSTQEFAVSTCLLQNRTASQDSNYWIQYSLVGDRGMDSQSTMHGYHEGSRAVLFADVGKSAVTCWNTGSQLTAANVAILASNSQRLSYPSDLHVSGDEVWILANSLPRFSYLRLDTSEYNFYVYRANIQELISGTICENNRGMG